MVSQKAGGLLCLLAVLTLTSVECRPGSGCAAKTAAILPGLGFFNRKDNEQQQQGEDQQQHPQQRPPPFPPRHGGRHHPPGRSTSYPFPEGRIGQGPARPQQFSPIMDRPPLPPPPRQSKSLGARRQPLPPPVEQRPDDEKEPSEEARRESTAEAAPPPSLDTIRQGLPVSEDDLQESQEGVPSPYGEHEGERDDEVSNAVDHHQQQLDQPQPLQQEEQDDQHPPIWTNAPYGGPFAGMPPPPGSWGGPPVDGTWGPPPFDATAEQWRMQQQQQQPPPQYYPPAQGVESREYVSTDSELVQQLRKDLEDSLGREHELIEEIHNLTAAFGSLRSQEDSHIQQVDMLTERLMEAEARASSERNAALEYRANCTEVGRALAVARDEIDEWKDRCDDLKDANERIDEQLGETTRDLKSRSLELEELALVVENLRLRDEHDKYLAERKKKKSGGFLGWLFSGFMRGYDEDEEQLDAAQELARSTLLRALQTERNNVHELEAAVSTLQQNNSAISEVVNSRDSLINELNDRVAVFEEDKIVLKAALRQLQKEIKEEAPKTQKLIDDLKDAKDETRELKAEVEDLISSHQNEIYQLQDAISLKQNAINDKESNLTVIGTYVDKLEERLGDFAMARRDIEIREEKCKQIEETAVQTALERDELKSKVVELTEEQGELKTLLEELATERTRVQREMATLQREKESLLLEEKQLRELIASMEVDVQQLKDILEEWKIKVRELKAEVEELQSVVEEASETEDEVSDVEDEVLAVVEVEKSIVGEDGATGVVPFSEVYHEDDHDTEQMKNEDDHDTALPNFMNEEEHVSLEIDGQPAPPAGGEGESDESVPRAPRLEPGAKAWGGSAEEGTVQSRPAPQLQVESGEKGVSQMKPPVGLAPPPIPGASTKRPDEPVPLRPPQFPRGIELTSGSPQRHPHRKVRFRKVRKAFSRATGVHGFFSRSRKRPPSKRRMLPLPRGRKTQSRQDQN